MRLINIEGNIGSGKTTLAHIVEEEYNAIFYQELADNETNKLLEKFYENKSKYSFELQVHFLGRRVESLRKAEGEDELIVMDRSIYGDAIFAEALFNAKEMTPSQFNTYVKLLTEMLYFYPTPNLMIYLDVRGRTLVDRIRKRNRGNENLITIDYLMTLEDIYLEWIDKYDTSEKIILSPDTFDINNSNQVVDLLEKIGEYI